MAVPHPQRELERLQQALAKGLPRITLVTGPAAWFRSRGVDAVLAAVPARQELRVVDGEERSDGRELELLEGSFLFGSGAFVAVRRGDAWLKAHGELLEATLPRIRAGSGLLLEAQKVDRRTRAGKALVEAAATFEFRELYTEPYDRSRSPLEAEIVGWIQERARAAGVPLTAEAAFLLLSVTGKEPADLLAELERLATSPPPGAAGGGGAAATRRAPLRPEDLEGRLTASFASTPFELAEALLGNDRRRCHKSLQAMFDRGVRDRDGGTMERGGLFPFITSWLWQALGQALQGRLLLEAGTPLRDVPGRAGVRVFAERFAAQVAQNPSARLQRGLELLLDCQRELRQSGEDPQALLEQFVARWFAARGAEASVAVPAAATAAGGARSPSFGRQRGSR